MNLNGYKHILYTIATKPFLLDASAHHSNTNSKEGSVIYQLVAKWTMQEESY
jgi:hypothetical protein